MLPRATTRVRERAQASANPAPRRERKRLQIVENTRTTAKEGIAGCQSTSWGSLVRAQYRPPHEGPAKPGLSSSLRSPLSVAWQRNGNARPATPERQRATRVQIAEDRSPTRCSSARQRERTCVAATGSEVFVQLRWGHAVPDVADEDGQTERVGADYPVRNGEPASREWWCLRTGVRIATRDRGSGKESTARDSRVERSLLDRGLRRELILVDEPAEQVTAAQAIEDDHVGEWLLLAERRPLPECPVRAMLVEMPNVCDEHVV